MKKAKAVTNNKPSTFLKAGYKLVHYSAGSLLLQKGSDLRLFHLTEYRDGSDPVHGTLVVSFVAKVP